MIPHHSAQLLSLHVGLARTHDPDQYSHRPWMTGFYKEPVEGPLRLEKPSLDGRRAALTWDAQSDLRVHGGPEKAVCVYPSEHYPLWREELGFDPFSFGAFGENFTLAGLTEAQVCIGDIFCIGEGPDAAQVQVSQPRQPCWKVARRWNMKDLALRVQQTGRTGWYFRVLGEGTVAPGQLLCLEVRPHPEWTVSLANQVMYDRIDDVEAAAKLAACDALSVSWKQMLSERTESSDWLDS